MANISVVEVRSALVSQGVAEEDITFPTKPADVPIYNLRLPIIPFVIVKPRSAQGVASAVKVAKQFSLKVQARGGGHSFANYGFGGVDGHMVVHLEHFTGFSIDPVSWRATIGPANRLEDVARKLHDNGGRALPHGVCPKVGISGTVFWAF
jgi:FAD/FMN-containing dehydrogenase